MKSAPSRGSGASGVTLAAALEAAAALSEAAGGGGDDAGGAGKTAVAVGGAPDAARSACGARAHAAPNIRGATMYRFIEEPFLVGILAARGAQGTAGASQKQRR